MGAIIEWFGTVDQKVIYIAVAVIAVLAVLAIIKKMVKLGAIILVLCILFSGAKTGLDGVKEKWWLEYNDGEIVATINSEKVSIPVNEVSVIMTFPANSGNTNNKQIIVYFVDGTTRSIEVPGFVASMVGVVAEKAGLDGVKELFNDDVNGGTSNE